MSRLKLLGLAELRMTSPAHSPKAFIMHYDMLHRGCGRLVEESDSDPWRPMFVRRPHSVYSSLASVSYTHLYDTEV